MKQGKLFEGSVVNVASVPQRSPFRYPGGKTWLIPIIRKWLSRPAALLVEPFAGGGIVSLTAAFESLAERITMVERDEEVSAVWQVILNGGNQRIADRIMAFDMTHENVNAEFLRENKTTEDHAFCTILKNRTYHGGIITKGSGFLKNGENGKGIKSRWYPETLQKRIENISTISNKIDFVDGDGFEVIEQNLVNPNACFFIDPPYVKAAKRLYTYFDIDHERLFDLASRIQGRYMMTYDDAPQIRDLAERYNLEYRTIPMKTTHHKEKNEIVVCDNFNWW